MKILPSPYVLRKFMRHIIIIFKSLNKFVKHYNLIDKGTRIVLIHFKEKSRKIFYFSNASRIFFFQPKNPPFLSLNSEARNENRNAK